MINAEQIATFEALIPQDAANLAKRIDELDGEVMRGAIAERFFPKLRLQQLLVEVTALHSFFAGRYWKWKAIHDNQEVESYITLKNAANMGGEKFVSASAEREAAYAVRPLNYVVGFYQGNLVRCQEYINSLKKLLETLEQEEQAQ